MSLLLIVLLVLLLAGGGFGYIRYGAVGGSGIIGTILIVILVLYLLGALGVAHASTGSRAADYWSVDFPIGVSRTQSEVGSPWEAPAVSTTRVRSFTQLAMARS